MSIKTHMLGIFLAVMMGACAQSAELGLPTITVHKSPTCGCCKVWAQHLRDAGFAVEVKNNQNLTPVKQRLGVPATMGSCHTAEVAGYFVEGHVPIEDIKRMLRDRPDAKGIAVPRMPVGSPGMKVPSGEVEPYSVYDHARWRYARVREARSARGEDLVADEQLLARLGSAVHESLEFTPDFREG